MSRSTAAASQTSGLLVVARARQLAFVDLATAAGASAAQPAGTVTSAYCAACQGQNRALMSLMAGI